MIMCLIVLVLVLYLVHTYPVSVASVAQLHPGSLQRRDIAHLQSEGQSTHAAYMNLSIYDTCSIAVHRCIESIHEQCDVCVPVCVLRTTLPCHETCEWAECDAWCGCTEGVQCGNGCRYGSRSGHDESRLHSRAQPHTVVQQQQHQQQQQYQQQSNVQALHGSTD